MIYNFTSCQAVIAKVMADLNLQEEDHRVLDMVTWVAEAIEKIGAQQSLELRVTGQDGLDDVVLEDYHAKLPNDLYRLEQVLYTRDACVPKPLWRTMRQSNHSFGASNDTNTFDYTYFIKPGHIQTNVRDGYLKIAYYAIPTDDRGFPLVPDTADYLEAVYWYIVMKLSYPMWVKGQIRDQVYTDAKAQWIIYQKRAFGEAMMPNKDGMESIKNAWLKLVPEMNAHKEAFGQIGQQELIYNRDKDWDFNSKWA